MKRPLKEGLLLVLLSILYSVDMYFVDSGDHVLIVVLMFVMPILAGCVFCLFRAKYLGGFKNNLVLIIESILHNALSLYVSMNIVTVLFHGEFFIFDSQKAFIPIAIYIYSLVASTITSVVFSYVIRRRTSSRKEL